MSQSPDTSAQKPSSGDTRRRIETQIHRRKKAKAVYPLESEWDTTSGPAPERLRMPSTKMIRGSSSS